MSKELIDLPDTDTGKNIRRGSPNIIWRPQPRQEDFLCRAEYEVLYGGAAGGGKSEAAIMIPLLQVHIPHFRALILRKTYPQLTELVDKSRAYYPRAFPGARYNESRHFWLFPSGAKVFFGSMHTRDDRENYRGRQFDVIIFDELTHFTWEEYSFMFSRNRPGGPGTFVCIRATTNPGGIGHGWVKKRFIDPAPPMTPISETMTVGGENIRRTRIFVPATVYDNSVLLSNDPGYLANLAMLPEAERRAQLDGSWDSFAGQVFTEWRDEPAHYRDRMGTHVIEPFRIPRSWRIWRGFDFGYSKPFAVLWFAADGDGRMYLIREFYGCTGVPNEGIRMEPQEIARRIREIEQNDLNLVRHEIIGIADPSVFDESRGESVARMMERRPNSVFFRGGDNHRLPGKMQFHNRLAFDERGIPGLYVFSTCRDFIRTIPQLTYDQNRAEDVDTSGEDHIYDAARYVFMERPITPPRPAVLRRTPSPLD